MALSPLFSSDLHRKGDFDKITIEHITEELSEKRRALQDEQNVQICSVNMATFYLGSGLQNV